MGPGGPSATAVATLTDIEVCIICGLERKTKKNVFNASLTGHTLGVSQKISLSAYLLFQLSG